MLVALGALLCYITVVVQTFVHGETGWGVASLFCCCGGILLAFIYGWVKSGEWGTGLLMTAWSLCVVSSIVLRVIEVACFGLEAAL